ncbi:MAG TPA: hypothetical protein VJ952_05025 [Opitutales bacterium]|nr:hypothetical protein [Opitutales bacterium]
MQDFETFKASREKVDPSCRKFSERQWQKAYAAYCSSRERVSDGGHVKTGESSKRRRGSNRERSAPTNYAHSPVVRLRNELRQNSAYGDLRTVVDILAWVAIGLVVLAGGLRLAFYTDGSVALAALLDTAVQVLGIAVLRFLAHAVIDIPDIALYKHISKQSSARREQAGEE